MLDTKSILNTIVLGAPLIISYVAPGYLFLFVFSWMRFSRIASSQDAILIKSIVVSHLLDVVCSIAFPSLDPTNATAIIIRSAAGIAVGYISGLVVNSRHLNKFLLSIGILRTTNPCIWDDVLSDIKNRTKKGIVWICAYNAKEKLYYIGQHAYSEDSKTFPLIALKYCKIATKKKKIIDGHLRQNENALLLLNINDFTSIELSSSEDDFFPSKISSLRKKQL